MKKIFILLILSVLHIQTIAQCWQAASTGYYHTIALKNGTLWAWGLNADGELGDGTYFNKNIPTQIGTISNWTSISARKNITLALKANGTLWAWGLNCYGQLGDSTIINKNTPVQIGTDTNWFKIFAGGDQNFALKKNGTLWVWGDNTEGEFGNGTYNNYVAFTATIPIQVGTDTNWKLISVDYDQVLALKTNGTLWGWGWNGIGQFGNGEINTN